MKSLYLIISLLFLAASCSDSSNDEVSDTTKVVEADTSQYEAFERHPKEVVSAEGVDVEVYDFANFEPFLSIEDDKIHLVNFWATWCIPCIQELPYFEQLGATNPDVEVLLVSLDFRKAVASDLIPYIIENEIQSEVILLHEPDANSWVPRVDPNWSGAIPATVIYKGNKHKFFEQSFTFEQLETELQTFK